ncbi:T9SS type A sorting domain-containing protein [Carboxylicivirga linearis]|uniref:T9SS type A sorting domain-containing protein n=1 Tax=Carboxylicivirga linearis TaxID=1628157 RepID=A0ABS5JTA1_9BACT|nr:T9SS type A sorting domain-containing protein [Carboxylicivirga linearis]MBS2098125.1 T9SS type A sorting domain-containing protein [Carboxylicivirga linearis]
MKCFQKNVITFVLLFFIGINLVNAQTDLIVYNGEDIEEIGTSYTSITVNSGGKVTFTSEVTTGLLTINEGGVMVVNGNLNVVTNGAAKLVIDGTLIVTGSLDISSSGNSESITVETSGVLVVGGSYTYGGKDNKEVNSGDVYLSDPTDWDGGNGIEGSGGDIADLIDSGVLPDEILEDFIDNYDGSGLPAYDWNGSAGEDWDDVSNWSDGQIPATADNVTIISSASNWPKQCTGKVYYMWNLTLEPNSQVVIPEGSRVTVYGDITIPSSASLTVINSDSSPSSFIHYGDVLDENDNPGEITYSWTYASRRYWYVGHSIQSADISSYEDIVTRDANAYFLYKFENGSWVNVNGGALEADPLTGYSLIVKDDGSYINHTGTPNYTDLSTTLSDGWQLIANPYPAYYQLAVEDPATGDFRNTSGSVYVRTGADANSRDLATYNVLTGISTPATFDGVLAPGQCFWVKKAQDGDVYMKANKRIHGTASLKSTLKEDNVLRINLQNDFATGEAVVAFRDNGQTELSRKDSELRMDTRNKISYLYSIKSEKKVVINVQPSEYDTCSIQLGYKAFAAGVHHLSLNNINRFDAEKEVVLEDKETGAFINLKQTEGYTFNCKQGVDNNRFVLHVYAGSLKSQEAKQAGVNDIDDKVSVTTLQEGTVSIKCNWDAQQKSISLYSIGGELVQTESFEGAEKVLKCNASGLYILKLTSEDKVYTQKIFIE